MKKISLYFLLILILLLPKNISAHAQTQVIEMTPDGFLPQTVTVDENSTVIFINHDKVARWPASNVHPTHDIYPEFDPQKSIEPGNSWPFKTVKVGEWKYHDHLLPHMRGTIIVKAENSNPDVNKKENTGINIFDRIKNIWDAGILKIKSYFIKNTPLSLEGFDKASPEKQISIIKSVAEEDPAKAWKLVKEKFKGQGGSSGNIHDLAHLTGSLLYLKKGFDGLSFCSSEFAFGCYHGFLDEAFKKDLDHLLEAQDACLKLGPENSGPAASCIHGIGHGVASFHQTADLKASLGSCRKLTSGREYCFDGVFMEFVRSAPESFFKKDDPFYPCDSLEKEFGYAYSFACGRNQPSLLMGRFKLGFEEVIPICLNSDSKPFKEACINALGFLVAENGNTQQIIDKCGSIGLQEFVSICTKAAAGELVFQKVAGWREKSAVVCNSLEKHEDCTQNVERLIKEYSLN